MATALPSQAQDAATAPAAASAPEPGARTPVPGAAMTRPPPAQTLPRVEIFGRRRIEYGPLPGLRLGREQIPGNLQSMGAAEIREAGALSLPQLMSSQLQSVTVNDYAGNPYQQDVNYRGFTAGPQVGTPQGLSVFFDGIRVNEPFGDVVNWDLLPLNAVERFDVFPGSNPLFGLNTLGGALSLRSKSGFTSPGAEGQVLTGSFGRRQAEVAVGGNDETWAGFAALNAFDERGWRDNSPSRVAQAFVRGDWRDRDTLLTASLLGARNELIGNGMVPIELFQRRAQTVFTSPDESRNRLLQGSLSATVDLGGRRSLTAQVYHRRNSRRGLNGDMFEGFEDLTRGANDPGERRHDGERLPQVLPVCRYIDADGDSVPDDPQPLNGPAGTGCSDITYREVRVVGARNGGHITQSGTPQAPTSGVIPGTPIGLLTRTELDQVTDGAAAQLNWNLDRHALMVGASLDRSRADYVMRQRLGLIDAGHRVYADPYSIAPEFAAAYTDVVANNFGGKQAASALYISETWSPTDAFHLSLSARYNRTRTRTDLRARTNNVELAEVGQLIPYLLCASADPASCDTEPRVRYAPGARNEVPTREDFTYRSFNPSLGASWQAAPWVTLFGNLSRGARVPSVVELGCAFDGTLVDSLPGHPELGQSARSLVGPTCSLPTALSGDPFLPQIRAASGELGLRVRLGSRWQANLSLYRTDLKDDLYFVGIGDGRSYFDTIGKTRRQGLEAGVKGRIGDWSLSANYSYTDATFQSRFYVLSPHNSSADFDQNSRTSISDPDLLGASNTLPSATAGENRGFGTYRMVRIDPGARLPGIAAHAFNASVRWQAGEDLRIGVSMQARSKSYVRGNENNRHQAAGTDQETGSYICSRLTGDTCASDSYFQLVTSPGRPFRTAGTVPGFATFDLDLSYKARRGLTFMARVTNLFDRRYVTAGRLGLNPFSPSGVGAIGVSGWNYNAAEWQNTTYVGPGAPRGVFIGLRYEFEDDDDDDDDDD